MGHDRGLEQNAAKSRQKWNKMPTKVQKEPFKHPFRALKGCFWNYEIKATKSMHSTFRDGKSFNHPEKTYMGLDASK